MMKTMNRLLLVSMVLLLGSCGKENYIYLRRQAAKTNQEFRVKEMKGSSAVDIIWVIDNSGSMDSYQQDVVANANAFMQDFIKKQLNWKMGVISTDSSDAPYAGFNGSTQLDATIVDPVNTFIRVVNKLGTNGSGSEETFVPILKSIGNDPSFLRPNTPLAVIMVTDAEEQSRISEKDFVNKLATATQGRNIFAYGVFAAEDFGCDSDEGEWDYKGSPYEYFIKSAMVGQTFPLCRDFGTSLVDIAHDIVTRVSYSAIYLSSRPDLSTLKVYYHDELLPAGPTEKGGFWMYDHRLNAVVFNNLDFAKDETDSVRVVFEEDLSIPSTSK